MTDKIKTETTETVKSEKKETKKTMRRASPENYGATYIDPKYQREGYRLRIVNDTPGRVAYLESKGYSLVREEVEVGSGSLEDPHQLGSAVEIEVGRTRSQKAVLMTISDEDYAYNRQLVKNETDEQDKMLGQTGIPTQYGKVTTESSKN